MRDDTADELLRLNQRLLESISAGDWETYRGLCDPSLTAIEPEAHGLLVEGLDFHKFYFDLGGVRGPHHTTTSSPHVRVLGDTAVLAYVRHVQRLGADGLATTVSFAETRVWHRRDGRWRHVHFHRSALA
jgi:calcium/calmodulin-dependent protein kinase (CaM kinase) II